MEVTTYTKVKDGRAFVIQSGHRGTASTKKVNRKQCQKTDCHLRDWQPNTITLQKATLYRISAVVSAKSVASRMHQKIIHRGQKKIKKQPGTCATVEDDKPSSTAHSTACSDFYDLDNFDLDADDVTEIEDAPPPISRSASQETYINACRKLGVAPSTSFYRHIDSTSVNMFHHSIGVKGAEACCIALMSNTSVVSLNMADNDLGERGAHYVSQMLEENIAITDLNLAENNIGSQGLSVLADTIINTDKLNHIDLSGNGLCERDATHIARILQECEHLRELNIGHNCFREKGGVAIATALKDNDSLEKLDLSWNHLRMKGAVEICKAIKVNIGLTSVCLAWNGLGLDGCRSLGTALTANAILLNLDLTSNRIDLEALKALLKGLEKNSTLKSLKLASNPFGSEGAVCLLRSVVKNEDSGLEELDISDQCVDQTFADLKQALSENRSLTVHHGVLLAQDSLGHASDDAFGKDDPMMVLMEFMRLENLRLLDLFASLDKDGSRSLTRSEFKNGLLSVNIPLSAASLDRLVNKLDSDGDSEVDFGELLAGQKDHKKKLQRIKQRQRDVPFAETEIGRLSMKIKAVLALRRGHRKTTPSSDSKNGGSSTDSKTLNANSEKRISKANIFQRALTATERWSSKQK